MRVCCCSMAGTKTCDYCYNSPDRENYHTYSFTEEIKIPTTDFSKEDYKEIIKYLIDKNKKTKK